MPSIRQLEYLTAIAEAHHFRRAAESVGVSQPTLSAQLSAMEDELGAQLVERSRARVILTPLGTEIVTIARRIIRDVQEIKDAAAGRRGQLAGIIRLGLPPTIGPYLLPRMVPRIHKAHPELKLYVREEVPHELPTRLQDGHHDLIIAPTPLRSKELASTALFREPLHLVVPADNPLAHKDSVERHDLRGQQVLTLEAGHQLREQVDAICAEFGAELQSSFEGTSLDTLRQMVGMGMGLAFLPGLYVQAVLGRDSSVKVVELKGRAIHRTLGLAWRRTSAGTERFMQLADHVRATVKRHFPDIRLL